MDDLPKLVESFVDLHFGAGQAILSGIDGI